MQAIFNCPRVIPIYVKRKCLWRKKSYYCFIEYTTFEADKLIQQIAQKAQVKYSYKYGHCSAAFVLEITADEIQILRQVIEDSFTMDFLPPWVCFPKVWCDSSAWRQGDLESWFTFFWLPLWRQLDANGKKAYLEKYPPSWCWAQKLEQSIR